ncbi:hypothetical protein IED13_09695 [Bosea sp. SSUT16]|uniref:Uncharacterized protein n=1 Tax=Bosea spartocytisi TaxID=2773451 RepID=A0A927E8U5_9HYPH|nr:hypothetical protein [Bosea spartocytisi]MBD3845970.1 hypothetical protein [Bosea spartocytisi]MCT4473154.1 hypothetical protein [Bosea spartocytisi]
MTPRTILVAIDVPDAILDVDLARRVQRVLREACIVTPDRRDLLWPDRASIEVTVFRLPANAVLTAVIGDPS